jgi:hypothetical protein
MTSVRRQSRLSRVKKLAPEDFANSVESAI